MKNGIIFFVNRDNVVLLVLPFVLALSVIFGHYYFLSRQTPQAHSKAIISRVRVDSISTDELSPIAPTQPLPVNVVGILNDIPTTKKQLNQLLENLKTFQVNTVLLPIGLTLDVKGNIIFPLAEESSEEMLVRWVKKTASEVHRSGFHTYLAFMFIEEPTLSDIAKYKYQLGKFIERWGSVAQEYQISFFDPGLTLGHASFRQMDQKVLQQLVVDIEHKVREVYTGRIGIELCCQVTEIQPRGYNHLLIVSATTNVPEDLRNLALTDAKRNAIERVFQLTIEDKRLTTLK